VLADRGDQVSAQPISDCDRCHRKGSCCEGFTLSSLFKDAYPTQLHALVHTAEIGLPFVPTGDNADMWLGPDVALGDRWLFSCPLLGKDGRCTEYETRPHACVQYSPSTDSLCALHPDNLEGLA
jgi:Fe-S-cluster containining protein